MELSLKFTINQFPPARNALPECWVLVIQVGEADGFVPLSYVFTRDRRRPHRDCVFVDAVEGTVSPKAPLDPCTIILACRDQATPCMDPMAVTIAWG